METARLSLLLLCGAGESRIVEHASKLGFSVVISDCDGNPVDSEECINPIGAALIDLRIVGFSFLDVWHRLISNYNAISIIWIVNNKEKDVIYRCFNNTEEISIPHDASEKEINIAVHLALSRYMSRESSLEHMKLLNRRKETLSPRQKVVFNYLLCGLRNTEIAYIMKMRADTVKEYKKIIFYKLGIQNSLEFLRYRGFLNDVGPVWHENFSSGSGAADRPEG